MPLARDRGTAIPLPAKAAWRDASWFASHGRAAKYHIMTDAKSAACSGAPLISESADEAATVPPEQRCMRRGCKEHWP